MAYDSLFTDKVNQSIIISGESGAGKVSLSKLGSNRVSALVARVGWYGAWAALT